jgi:putative nucleotidyltransferase with HDIG domain
MISTVPIPNNLAAIVLAAGASSRMRRLKPLLRLGETTALERSISLFHDAGVNDVLVVLGNRGEELRPIAERCGARCVHNARWYEGMYSSIVAGAQSLPRSALGVFVLPADVPLVRPATVRQLAAAFAARPDSVIYPVFEGERGHPPLIARPILDEAAGGAPGPLSALLVAHQARAIEVLVPDLAIHLDMDTPSDFDALRVLASRREIPTPAECECLFTSPPVRKGIVRHSRKVAEVAGQIADALVKTGLEINPELVRAAALLHDLAKGQPKHAEAAAEALRALDMPTVARVVAAHTDMEFVAVIDERAIVYLADKLVAGEQLVTLEQRFQRALKRFHHRPDALAAAHRRKAVAGQIANAVEARLGVPLIAILHEKPAVVDLEIAIPEGANA